MICIYFENKFETKTQKNIVYHNCIIKIKMFKVKQKIILINWI